MINKKKIILDTDIGDDIDDAFALLLALKSQKIDLLGVTTVFRNANKRAKMAKFIIDELNENIEVYAGEDNPLSSKIENIVQKEILLKEQKDEFDKYLIPQWKDEMNDCEINEENAIDFIIRTIKENPHEVILVPIGPLTNIAKAFMEAPEIIPLIKEVRIMGGSLYIKEYPEWNIWCDVEAAKIVFNSGVNLTCITLDTTLKTALSNEDVLELKNSSKKELKTIYEMMQKWFKHYEFTTPVMHDPLTIASLINEDLITYKYLPIDINVKDYRGFFFVNEEKNNNILASIEVNKEEFLKLFKSIIL